MTKLETNIANIEGNVDLGEFLQSDLDAVISAAKSYAALQKLAPEIGALVEDGFVDQHDPQTVYSGAFTKGAIGFVSHNSTSRWAGWLFWKHPDGQCVSLGQIPEAANARPTLKAIHDNLTQLGK